MNIEKIARFKVNGGTNSGFIAMDGVVSNYMQKINNCCGNILKCENMVSLPLNVLGL